MEAVNVFGWRNSLNHLLRFNVGRQRQLHQDAMNGWIAVERVDACEQGVFRHVGRVLLQHRVQAAFLTGLDLVAHVDLRGGVLADQQYRQARCDALRFKGCSSAGDFGA